MNEKLLVLYLERLVDRLDLEIDKAEKTLEAEASPNLRVDPSAVITEGPAGEDEDPGPDGPDYFSASARDLLGVDDTIALANLRVSAKSMTALAGLRAFSKSISEDIDILLCQYDTENL